MNCQRTSSLLSAYLDRELTGEEMLLIQSHLSRCNSCDEEYESLRMVKRLLGALSPTAADAAWAESLTELAVAGRPSPWDRLWAHWFDLERRTLADPDGTQRGRRLARSLALSALALFLVAAPFAQRESPVLTGAMGPTGLGLRPAWQPPMPHPAFAPPLSPMTATALPLNSTPSGTAGSFSASPDQWAAPARFSGISRAQQRWLFSPWATTPRNYLTFSNLEH